MANPLFSSPINLNIPNVPAGIPDELAPTFQGIYNALRILQQAIGDFTGASSDAITYTLSLDLLPNKSLQVQKMQFIILPAGENLSSGQFVTMYDSGAGVMKFKRADANAVATRAHGWIVQTALAGDKVIGFLFSGYKVTAAGLTPGATYYLSDSTLGGISATKPVGAGKIVQEVGVAYSSTELLVHLSTPIVL